MCNEEQLIAAVDRLVTDEELKCKVTAIGQRIRGTNDKKTAADGVEKIVLEYSKWELNLKLTI